MAEVLRGYRIRMWGFQKFVDSLFALHKYAQLENGRVLVRKVSGFHSFVVSFLRQEEANRFSYNFSQDPAFPNFKEFQPAPNYEAKCVPIGHLIPERVVTKLAKMLASDILLCWESFNVRCHRRLVAEWLEEKCGIVVPELEHERAESVPFSEQPSKWGAKPSLSMQTRMLF